MSREVLILVINPGSTSTKVALFNGNLCLKRQCLEHCADEIKRRGAVLNQLSLREEAVFRWMKEEGIDANKLSAVIGRGGLLRPLPGGTYFVSDMMINDLKEALQGEHASNLGGIIARHIGDGVGIPSFIANPVSTDEFEDVARFSGFPELPRKSHVHALNIKAVSLRAAERLGTGLAEANFVVAHLGGGISVSPVRGGRIIDVATATADGPFSPDRAGRLPATAVIDMCFSGRYTRDEMIRKYMGNAGLLGYLATNDARVVEERIKSGDKEAAVVYDAMCYKISKEISGMASALSGRVDAVVLTGGLSYSKMLVDNVKRRTEFIAPVMVFPGEDEMYSLSAAALRVLDGEEGAKVYEDETKDRWSEIISSRYFADVDLHSAAGEPDYTESAEPAESEMCDIARISGMPGIDRRSSNTVAFQKIAAERYARQKGCGLKDMNLIVAYLGKGISVGVHSRGRVTDVNRELSGEGPISPEMSGTLPAGDLMRLCFSGRYTKAELEEKVVRSGGLKAYIGTGDIYEILSRKKANDTMAALLFDAMAYQVAKEIGRCAAAVCGCVDRIILTGRLAGCDDFTAEVESMVSFIAGVTVYSGDLQQ